MWRNMRIASDMVRVCLSCGLWVAKSYPTIDGYFPPNCTPVDMNKWRLEINGETLKVRVKNFDCWQKLEAYCGID